LNFIKFFEKLIFTVAYIGYLVFYRNYLNFIKFEKLIFTIAYIGNKGFFFLFKWICYIGSLKWSIGPIVVMNIQEQEDYLNMLIFFIVYKSKL
jgi:hypothetical protein